MGLLVVGTLAFDSVETPFDKADNALGGSGTFIAIAASYFSGPVKVVGVVGEDFPKEYFDILERYNADLEGVEVVKGGKTFRWAGKYHYDMNTRDTLATELNVLEQFDPKVPESWRSAKYVVLGNIDPTLQLKVLDQLDNPSFVVCDTMNFWIDGRRDELMEVIKRVDMLIINDSEARQLADEPNLVKAAGVIREMGVRSLIIKKGEHGALLFIEDVIFSAPAYPLEMINDPTGAGDSFAGGLIGYLHKTQDVSAENLKRAVIYGSSMASFCVEQFSIRGLEDLSDLRINDRFREFVRLSAFDEPTA
ncbi:MAG: sugar kinase [Ignavibacteriales bacterium]|nr:sugar kinase [Ignavibacteriales bacterium]